MDAIISIPRYAIVASFNKFLPRYDVGSWDQADESIMSSPHLWNLLELPRIKVLSLVWSIVWMPPSVYPTTAIVALSGGFFRSMMMGAWTMPICLSCPVHIYGISSNKGLLVAGMEYCVDVTISIPNYCNRGII